MFNHLAEIYSNLEASGVTVFSCPLHGSSSVASDDGYIGIDCSRFGSQREEVTALIHEEGHFTAGAFYTPYSPYQIKAQAEYRADKAATLKRVPLDDLVEEIRQGFSIWEIAEHFNVLPSFIWRAYTIYRDNLGIDFEALA